MLLSLAPGNVQVDKFSFSLFTIAAVDWESEGESLNLE